MREEHVLLSSFSSARVMVLTREMLSQASLTIGLPLPPFSENNDEKYLL